MRRLTLMAGYRKATSRSRQMLKYMSGTYLLIIHENGWNFSIWISQHSIGTCLSKWYRWPDLYNQLTCVLDNNMVIWMTIDNVNFVVVKGSNNNLNLSLWLTWNKIICFLARRKPSPPFYWEILHRLLLEILWKPPVMHSSTTTFGG